MFFSFEQEKNENDFLPQPARWSEWILKKQNGEVSRLLRHFADVDRERWRRILSASFFYNSFDRCNTLQCNIA